MKIISVIAALSAALVGENMKISAVEVPENMVWIPAGTFMMGDPFSDSPDNWGERGERTLHTVYVNGFYMDKYKITGTLWSEVYLWAIKHGYSLDNVGHSKAPDHPVLTISWFDAVKWCNARSEKEGRTPAYYTDANQVKVYRVGKIDIQNDWVKWDSGYRLPTEAEWEKAARGGLSGKRFPWGDTISHVEANYFSDKNYTYDINPTKGYHSAWNNGLFPYTSSVGSFAPNGYGLYDMAGNASDWCWDWYSNSYPSSSPRDNPRGPVTGSRRVIHNSGWNFSALYCRLAARGDTNPDYGNDFSLSIGFRTVLAQVPDWRQAIETQPLQPTYGDVPKKEDGKKKVVVVTHGWQPAFLPVDIAWVDTMTNAISKYLISQGRTDWQVHAHRWVEGARPPITSGLRGATRALANARREGASFGKYVLERGFDEVHVIAHSAGAEFAQGVSETIKSVRLDIVVHLTFLDPFVGFDYAGRTSYGKGADWAENYFSRDTLTSPIGHQYTEGSLDNAYNVDVTLLDPNKEITDTFRSSPIGTEYCYETRTSHKWPYQFYTATISPNAVGNSQDFGFPLSKESEGLANAMVKYGKRGNVPKILGTPDPQCPSGNLYVTTPSFVGEKMEFKDTSSVKSSTGGVKLDKSGFILVTGSPVWFTQNVIITNKANFLSLECRFMSGIGAEGLLSVYSGTNVIGIIDERVTPVGARTNTFVLPETATAGASTLGFRLDAFSGVQSSVTITNVVFGFAGLNQPFSLNASGVYDKGRAVFQLMGPAGYNYSVEVSTNLTDWTPIALLANTSGTVRFFDSSSNNTTTRFYRAVSP